MYHFSPLDDVVHLVSLRVLGGVTGGMSAVTVLAEIADVPTVGTAGMIGMLVTGAVAVARIFADSAERRAVGARTLAHDDDCRSRLDRLEGRLDALLERVVRTWIRDEDKAPKPPETNALRSAADPSTELP